MSTLRRLSEWEIFSEVVSPNRGLQKLTRKVFKNLRDTYVSKEFRDITVK